MRFLKALTPAFVDTLTGVGSTSASDVNWARTEELAVQNAAIEAENALRAKEQHAVSNMRAQFAKEKADTDKYIVQQLALLEKYKQAHHRYIQNNDVPAQQDMSEYYS